MPQYQGGFYTGQQAAGDVLRQIFEGLRIGRQDGMVARDQRRVELEREQARADRLEQQQYTRGREATADAAAAENAALARALNLSQLRERGIRQGAAPTNATASIDLRGLGGVGASALPDPTRYTQMGEGFYEDRDATPAALAAQQRQTIARIAQRVAAGDQSALGDAVAAGLNPRELDPAARPGTPQYLAAQRAELELKDGFDARQSRRQVAGQLQVANAARAADAASATGKPPTEGELSGAGFLSRAMEAHGQLEGIKTPNTVSRLLGDGMVTGQTDTFRQWNAVRKNFATAVLRKESGASISPTEFEGVDAMYIPLPGDSEELLATKRANREGALRTLQIMSGRASGLAFQGSSPILDGGQTLPTGAPRNPYR
jgi:hypothetical protein